jgi:hypothetical protein
VARAHGLRQTEGGMQRFSVALLLLLLLCSGCMKATAAAPSAPLVVQVTSVSGAGIAVVGPSASEHSSSGPDGHAAGDRVEIEWQGSWLPATLVERRGDRWLVRYETGEGREFVETVERERIRIPVAPADDDSGEVDVDP